MAVKSFIRGDFRTLVIDNDYPTNYKVYYNGRWNYIQDEESFIKRLNPDLGESYLNRFNLKVLDNNQWVKLAILENYYNKNEKRNSIFYRTITKENFSFKPRAVNFTEVDARLGLNNLQTPFVGNKIKYNKEEIEEITDRIQKDEILYKLGNVEIYNELDTINYKLSEKDNFESNTNTNFLEDKTELDYYYNTKETEVLELNNSNTFEISNQLEITNNCITFKQDLSNAKKVKEVLINNWSTSYYYCCGWFDFYDENLELIECGNVITSNLTNAETDNFLVESSSTYSSAFLPLYAINNYSKNYYAGVSHNNDYLKITFKQPRYITKIITSIKCEPYAQNDCDINLIYEDDTIYTYNIASESLYEVITLDELLELYKINEIQSLKTTVNNFTNFDVNSFSSFGLNGNNLSENDCDLKFAIKFDNNNYYTFKNEQWNSIAENKTEIFNNGMTLEEFTSISKNNIINQFGNVQTCDIFISILNKNKMNNIPQLNSIIKNFNNKTKHNVYLIDEIYFDNFNSLNNDGDCGGRYLFYNKDGNLIEFGNIITDTLTYAESENFIMEAYSVWGNSTTFKVSNAFRTDISKEIIATPFVFGSFQDKIDNSKQFLKLKFKTPQYISKILCNPAAVDYSRAGTNTSNCDIHMKFNNQDIKKITIYANTHNQLTTLENFNDINYYDKLTGVIKTNTNQLKNISKIEKIKIIANELENTKVKIALSVDSKSTYLKFNGTNWDTIQENDIINNGNTINEINNLTYQDFSCLDLTNKTLDFIVCMETSDTTVTPNIKKIIVTSMNKE